MENFAKLHPTPCEDCDSLCCNVLEIIELNKGIGIPCKHLKADGKCGIYPTGPEADHREGVCKTYECAGSGKIVTELFKGANLEDEALKKARDDFFASLQYHAQAIVRLEAFVENSNTDEERHTANELVSDLNKYYESRANAVHLVEEALADSSARTVSDIYKVSEEWHQWVIQYISYIKRKYNV